MRYKHFKNADADISALTVGTWGIAGANSAGVTWGDVDTEESIAAIRQMIDNGVNMVDTAPIYGDGHSETVVGQALKDGYREKVYLATKFGSYISHYTGKSVRDNKYNSVEREIDESLARLQTDYIDFYIMHWPDENTPIESKSLSKIIESSQKKVEGRNFSIRKNVLNYDDVMNTQREIIYKERQQVLDGEDLHDSILKMMEELISDTVKQYINEEVVDRTQWNLVGLKDHFLGWITEENDLEYEGEDLEKLTVDTLIETLTEKAKSLYAAREEQYGSDVIRELERVVMLKVVDTKWMAHIDDMSELKKGIGLRAYGQQNPVVEYRYEGFEMFDAMVASIKEDTIRMLLTMQLRQNQAPEREQVSKPDAPNAGAGDGSFGTQRRNPARAAKKNQK